MNSLEKSPNTGTENNSAKGIALAVTGAVMWGIMGIFVRYLSGAGYTSFDIAFLRCLSAGILFFVFKAVSGLFIGGNAVECEEKTEKRQ